MRRVSSHEGLIAQRWQTHNYFCPPRKVDPFARQASSVLLPQGLIVYNTIMSSRFAPSPRSKLIRNTIGVLGAMVLTLLVFLAVAAFRGALQVINEITDSMPLRCPDGYDLVAAADGSPMCKAKPPPPVMGIVPVTLPKLSEPPTTPAPSASQPPAQKK